MNTHALQRSNSATLMNLLKAWQFAGLFLFLGACATSDPYSSGVLSTGVLSTIDAQFKLQRVQKSSDRAQSPKDPDSPKSPGVSFYQNVLRSTLNSECAYFPSDSAFAQILAKRCSPVKTMLKSFARFSLEPDAAYLGRPIVRLEEKIHFEDIPNGCAWLD